MTFSRKFSLNFRKNLRVPMTKMTFTSDFTNTVRGDLYPIIEKVGEVNESVCSSVYTVKANGGSVERLMGAFFPFATYQMDIKSADGSAGFVFAAPEARAEILFEKGEWESYISIKHNDGDARFILEGELPESFSLLITARCGFFDIYTGIDGSIDLIGSAEVPSFRASNNDSFYHKAKVHVKLCGSVSLSGAESYVDCGIGQADVRPFRYENGDLFMENGRIFIAFSVRNECGGYQGVLAWVPGTADFEMTGAIFYSIGNGKIYGDVATAYVFDRNEKVWHLWQRSGAGGHVLAYAKFTADVRYGVNVVDVKPLPLMTEENLDDKLLLGKKGDEDPDFFYDEKRKKWLFALCRVIEETKKYQYCFFESDRPDTGYEFIGQGPAGEETGGSIVKLDGKIYFVCGNDFKATSSYRVYEWGKFDSFEPLKSDYPDGGFRGWGTVMPVDFGTRRRYFWLTFDRKLMNQNHNWSYGNLYCFEAEGVYPI